MQKTVETTADEVQLETCIDVLDRQPFVDQMLSITNTLSDNKKNACFAVDGDWGVGKSFVLDMFEKQASQIKKEGNAKQKYAIFRYNCWEYDYYEEPLIAMISSMLNDVEKKTITWSKRTKTAIKATLKDVGVKLARGALQVLDKTTGLPVSEVVDSLEGGLSSAKNMHIADRSFDYYFDFKQTIGELRNVVAGIAKQQTVVLLVDELDRCLPEYAMKVLERLHHLFEGLTNTQVIISIDIKQMEHIVEHTFGRGTNAKKYLQKIVQFELKLQHGTINERFEERFEQYINQFEEKDQRIASDEVSWFRRTLLEGYDIRHCISIVDKSMLVHGLCADENASDVSYLCLELFFSVLAETSIVRRETGKHFNINNIFDSNDGYLGDASFKVPQGLEKISEHYSKNITPNGAYYYYNQHAGRNYVFCDSLMGLLLCAYRSVLGYKDDWFNDSNAARRFVDYGKKYWELLQMIG